MSKGQEGWCSQDPSTHMHACKDSQKQMLLFPIFSMEGCVPGTFLCLSNRARLCGQAHHCLSGSGLRGSKAGCSRGLGHTAPSLPNEAPSKLLQCEALREAKWSLPHPNRQHTDGGKGEGDFKTEILQGTECQLQASSLKQPLENIGPRFSVLPSFEIKPVFKGAQYFHRQNRDLPMGRDGLPGGFLQRNGAHTALGRGQCVPAV